MKPFSLLLPGETLFGAGRLEELPAVLARPPFGPVGGPVALARGGGSFTTVRDRLSALLARAGVRIVELPPQTREPEPEDVDAATEIARRAGVTAVVAIGGGSVLDLGKAVAALAPQYPAYPVRAYLEDVGEGRTLQADPLPLALIPTTAGTGTEATKNAVISSQRDGFKKSLRDPRMIANVALIDPELTLGLPPAITAATGLDALTQLIESYTSRRAQPVTDALALRGLEAARALPQAYRQGDDLDARADMALAAYLSGVCLANAGLGAAHGIAAALGSVTPLPHGLACALALPWVMAANAPAVPERYARIAEILTGHADVSAGIAYLWTLLNDLGIPRLRDLPAARAAVEDERLPELAARCQGNSLRGNPRTFTDAELIDLLRAMRDADSPLG